MNSTLKKAIHSNWGQTLKLAGQNFFSGQDFIYAASVAFYALLSLPALVFIALMAGGSIYEEAALREEFLGQIQGMAGSATAEQIRTVMANASVSGDSLVMQVISIITLVISATTLFVALQNSLNSVWNIKPQPKRGYVKQVIDRLISLAMVVGVGFLLLISLLADTVVGLFKDLIAQYMKEVTYYIIFAVNTVVAFGLNTVIFALLYRFLPDAHLRWKDVFQGAFVAALLFFVGKYLIGIYVGNTPLTETYGAAGSLVVLLLWVYYSVIIFLFGAEITYAYCDVRGHNIKPHHNAILVTTKEIEPGADKEG